MNRTISIIIVNHNSTDDVDRCLQNINEVEIDGLEVVVIDNNPCAEKKLHHQPRGRSVYYFPQPHPLEIGAALNFGARHASGEYLLFMTSTIAINTEAITSLIHWLGRRPRTVVGPRMVNARGEVETSAWPFVSRRHLLGAETIEQLPWPPALHPWLAWLVPPLHFSYMCRVAAMPFTAPVLSADCLMMSRKVWDEVGSWNDQLAYFGMESEWFNRAADHGVASWYLPEAVVRRQNTVSQSSEHPVIVIEKRDRSRQWYARRFGVLAVTLLAIVIWAERQLRHSRRQTGE